MRGDPQGLIDIRNVSKQYESGHEHFEHIHIYSFVKIQKIWSNSHAFVMVRQGARTFEQNVKDCKDSRRFGAIR